MWINGNLFVSAEETDCVTKYCYMITETDRQTDREILQFAGAFTTVYVCRTQCRWSLPGNITATGSAVVTLQQRELKFSKTSWKVFRSSQWLSAHFQQLLMERCSIRSICLPPKSWSPSRRASDEALLNLARQKKNIESSVKTNGGVFPRISQVSARSILFLFF